MPPKKNKYSKLWSIAPFLCDEVLRLLSSLNLSFDFYPYDNATSIEDYDINIIGRFSCYNASYFLSS